MGTKAIVSWNMQTELKKSSLLVTSIRLEGQYDRLERISGLCPGKSSGPEKSIQGRGADKVVKIVIFDMDGTLIDSGSDITASVNHVRQKVYNLKPLSISFVVESINREQRNLTKFRGHHT